MLRAPGQVQSLVFSLVFVLLLLPFCSSSRNTITYGNPILDLENETLVSANRRFELGFFTPNGGSSTGRYVGIWYHGHYPLTVVWVANRDKPLVNNVGFFGLAKDGNLAVWTSSQQMWSSRLKGKVSSNRTIRLLDTGNLVLGEAGESQDLWESFKNPADTFIPGMPWRENSKLTSWNAVDDPKPGNFSFPYRDGEYVILKQVRPQPYWKSGIYKMFQTDDMITVISCLLSNSSCSLPDNSEIISVSDTRLVMEWTGQIRLYSNASEPRNLSQYQPRDVCNIFQYCGNYGSCNNENRVPCKCLPGSEPSEPEQWSSGEFSAGCRRKKLDSCKAKDFISFKNMIAGSPEEIGAVSKEECRDSCLSSCLCEAYNYQSIPTSRDGNSVTSSICWTWSNALNNIEELTQTEDDYNLNFRVASTQIDSMKRSCKLCGTNIVPYPLSINKTCGDPSYLRFSCDSESSQLYFIASNARYRVTSITPEVKKFAISFNDYITSCTSEDLLNKTLQLDHSLQFYLISGCNSSRNFIPSTFSQDQILYEVEIGWSTPHPQSCASNSDCVYWPGTTCSARGHGKTICHCNANTSWNPLTSNCAPVETSMQSRRSSPDKKPLYLIALASIAVVILLVGLCYYRRRRAKNEIGEGTKKNPSFRLSDSEQRIREWISSNQFQEKDKKGIDVPSFDLEIISAATDNFSKENKLGQGGFGPVYKGKFPGGQEIAIKRLSSASGQGLEEFKNEVVLIAKLQHRNLVRLLGYCIQGEEKMLLYEYMPNGSLDSFIFDHTRCLLLTWTLRFEIILGIARGMLYLHQDSRLRIIHRDMKSSNVLLDEEMNPKISDFGLARIFESKQTEATTKRVIGTYGYMSPEYALDGYFSFKSDVFSFGVVVLEIISGKRNTAFYPSMGRLNLVSYAWKFWSENNASNLMDDALRETCNASELLKCINVALLCVQQDPTDRPTMSNILFMLASETASLPAPKQPGFATNESLSTTSASSKLETMHEISTTIVQGR